MPKPSASVSHALKWAKGMKMQMHHTVPRRLNSRWPMAARLAATLPLMDASSGVMVVPMLLPSTRAQASSNVIQPLLHMMRVMANVAADDCMTIVTTMPTSTNSSTEAMPIDEYSFKAMNISGLLCRSGT